MNKILRLLIIAAALVPAFSNAQQPHNIHVGFEITGPAFASYATVTALHNGKVHSSNEASLPYDDGAGGVGRATIGVSLNITCTVLDSSSVKIVAEYTDAKLSGEQPKKGPPSLAAYTIHFTGILPIEGGEIHIPAEGTKDGSFQVLRRVGLPAGDFRVTLKVAPAR